MFSAVSGMAQSLVCQVRVPGSHAPGRVSEELLDHVEEGLTRRSQARGVDGPADVKEAYDGWPRKFYRAG